MGLLNPALRYEFIVLERHKRHERWTKSLNNRTQREARLATEPLCVHVSNLSRQVVRRHYRGSTEKESKASCRRPDDFPGRGTEGVVTIVICC